MGGELEEIEAEHTEEEFDSGASNAQGAAEQQATAAGGGEVAAAPGGLGVLVPPDSPGEVVPPPGLVDEGGLVEDLETSERAGPPVIGSPSPARKARTWV